MKKFEKFLLKIEKSNELLKEKYIKASFGYVFYKDYYSLKYQTLALNHDHIKVIPPSSLNVKIPHSDYIFKHINRKKFNFLRGDDYAEDWANPLYEISELKLVENYQNIVIHICDSGAHGYRFSDYDENNEQENLLIEALTTCATKKIKIIGLLFNEFSRNSFIGCQYIYLNNKGYYNIEDLNDLK